MRELFTVAFMVIVVSIFSQQVYAPAGASLSNAQLKIDNTIGEPITLTLQNGTNKLTQGFQQNTDSITTAIKTNTLNVSIQVFPNPATDNLQIYLSQSMNEVLTLSFFNIQGEKIWQGNMGNGVEWQTIDMGQLATGSYLLQVADPDKNTNVYKIEKFNH